MLPLMHSLGIYKRFNSRRRQFTWPSFGVSDETRTRHLLAIGKTGMGKSTFMLNSIVQDIRRGGGCIVIDPKGDLAHDILPTIPPERHKDVIYFDPSDVDFPIPYNPLRYVESRHRSRIAANVLAAFHHLFKDSWGPQLQQILRNALLVSLYTPGASLLDVKFMLTHKTHRAFLLNRVSDNPMLKDYWEFDFAEHMSDKEQRDRTLSSLNKLGQFLTDPTLLNILSQPTGFDFGTIMDGQKIFIANLDAGTIGEDASELLGSLLISSVHSAALARQDRSFFPVYVDEFHLFGASSYARMVSILRGFGVGLTLACQHLAQLDPDLRAAILGTIGTLVAFQTGVEDADKLAPLFRLTREDDKLHDLPPYVAYVRTPQQTLRLNMPVCDVKTYATAPRKIIRHCRDTLAQPRREVEQQVALFVKAA